MMTRMLVAGAGLAIAGASNVLAVTEVQIDVNSLSVQSQVSDGAGGWLNAAFGGTTHTGRLVLSDDANSVLAGVLLNNTTQTLSSSLASFAGVINLVGGVVMGGSLSVTNLDGSSYTASIVSGIGTVNVQVGQGFQIDGLTFAGLFSGPLFAGVDVSPFFSVQPLFGSLLNFAFSPDAGGHDADSDIDIWATIPLPASGGLAALGLAGLAGVRRRR